MAVEKYDIKKDGPRPADKNEDGKITESERGNYRRARAKARRENEAGAKKAANDQQDKLTGAALEKEFGFAKDVIWSNPELRKLYKDAIAGQWEPEKFQAEFRSTKWYSEKADYARKAWAAEKTGGADWEAQLAEGREAIEDWAVRNGARLTDQQKNEFARRYWFQGWNDADRASMMDKELSQYIQNDEGFMRGQSGDVQESMMQAARRNGLTFSPGYFESAARSIASGLTTEDDWLREIREQAASKWPSFSDKIMSGLDVEDLASGYINTMANVWEVPSESINLDDPFIRQALQGRNEKGEPSMESLWDFEYRLKSDPKWTQTKNGANEVASVGMDILRRMGFQG